MSQSPAALSRPWETFPAYTVWRRSKTIDLATRELHLLHGAVGVADEIGEFFEVANELFARIARGTPAPEADYLKLRKEAGDVFFYRDLAQDVILTSYNLDVMRSYAAGIPDSVDALDARVSTGDEAIMRFRLAEAVVGASKVLGPVKKHVFYRMRLDDQAIAPPLVYLSFAIASITSWVASKVDWANATGPTCPGTVSAILRANVEKLDERYRDGFEYGGGNRDGKGA